MDDVGNTGEYNGGRGPPFGVDCVGDFDRMDASVKSILPPRFRGVVVFAAFFRLLAVASTGENSCSIT